MAEPQTNPSSDPDWPVQVTDYIVNRVEAVRTKTTEPAIKVGRAVVLGVIAAFLGVGVVILACVGLIRLLDAALPGTIWVVYLVLGVLFTGLGLAVWQLRLPETKGRAAPLILVTAVLVAAIVVVNAVVR
jgi:hypothetical protein